MLRFVIILLSMQVCLASDMTLISFFNSMKKSENFIAKDLLEDEEWQTVMTLYTAFQLNHKSLYRAEPRIPKIIHQIWLGSELLDCILILILNVLSHLTIFITL